MKRKKVSTVVLGGVAYTKTLNRAYANGFVNALMAGRAPQPSGCDCWRCHVKEEKTGRSPRITYAII